ncbi:MAG TPA: hypothetical protein VGB26_02960 [Nitrospiria bacterium]
MSYSVKSKEVLILTFLAAFVGISGSFHFLAEAKSGSERGTGLGASQIVFDPQNPKNIYVSSTFYGVYTSKDEGKTWEQKMRGMGASDYYTIAVYPKDPRILLIGAAGGGIYKSKDSADTWEPANNGLTDTSVYDIVFDPVDSSIVYALTLREIFVSQNLGNSWAPLFIENPRVMDPTFHRRLLIYPGKTRRFVVGTGEHGYQRMEGGKKWELFGDDLSGLRVTAFGSSASFKELYMGARRGEGLYLSRDGGKSWGLIGDGLKEVWVNRIAVDPFDPHIIYLATNNKGMLKSSDEGKTWKSINNGLSEIGVKALGVHPEIKGFLIIATYNQGIFTSENQGKNWTHRKVPGFPTWDQLRGSLTRNPPSKEVPPPPTSFSKCQTCHAWTDPILNGQKNQTFWRTFPSRRDWTATLERMKTTAQLSASEEIEILDYLNTYYGLK